MIPYWTFQYTDSSSWWGHYRTLKEELDQTQLESRQRQENEECALADNIRNWIILKQFRFFFASIQKENVPKRGIEHNTPN